MIRGWYEPEIAFKAAVSISVFEFRNVFRVLLRMVYVQYVRVLILYVYIPIWMMPMKFKWTEHVVFNTAEKWKMSDECLIRKREWEEMKP